MTNPNQPASERPDETAEETALSTVTEQPILAEVPDTEIQRILRENPDITEGEIKEMLSIVARVREGEAAGGIVGNTLRATDEILADLGALDQKYSRSKVWRSLGKDLLFGFGNLMTGKVGTVTARANETGIAKTLTGFTGVDIEDNRIEGAFMGNAALSFTTLFQKGAAGNELDNVAADHVVMSGGEAERLLNMAMPNYTFDQLLVELEKAGVGKWTKRFFIAASLFFPPNFLKTREVRRFINENIKAIEKEMKRMGYKHKVRDVIASTEKRKTKRQKLDRKLATLAEKGKEPGIPTVMLNSEVLQLEAAAAHVSQAIMNLLERNEIVELTGDPKLDRPKDVELRQTVHAGVTAMQYENIAQTNDRLPSLREPEAQVA